jgi:Protein of unknown function (DUF2867)
MHCSMKSRSGKDRTFRSCAGINASIQLSSHPGVEIAMSVEECAFPQHSAIDRQMVDAAYFRDSYRTPLRTADSSMAAIFFDLFGHNPGWVKALLLARNRIAAGFGLDVPKAADIQHPTQKAHYAVGDLIGPWPIFCLTEHELIAGRDNKHLDFRLSLLREQRGGETSLIVSTVCDVHNMSGKIYLFFIVPFHKWGVKNIISKAAQAGRL